MEIFMIKQVLAVLLLIPTLAFSWEPTKPVTVLIGFGPGSGNEISFRKASEIVQKNNPKFSYVIENKPGVGAILPQNAMMTAPADGYTISIPSHMSLFVTNDIWEKNIKKFNWDSFTNVVTLGKSPLVLVANNNSVIDTPQAFVSLIKLGYRPVNVGVGGGAHRMAFEYIMYQAGGDAKQVKSINYKGPLQTVVAVAGGEIEFGIMPIAVAKPLIDAGKVKVVGLTTSKKLDHFPLLSTTVPGIGVYAGWMISLPPNTPKDIVKWYQTEFSRAVSSKEYRDWASQNFILVIDDELSVDGTHEYGKKLRAQFAPIIKNINTTE